MSALEAAHAQGVVHRDLKPENVMINHTAAGELQVKLLDLGIAKLHDIAERTWAATAARRHSGRTNSRHALLHVARPVGRTLRDGQVEIDGRADIYSLGVICYELVTGEKPFTGYTLGELRLAHISQKPLLHEVTRGVPPEFAGR